MLDELLFGAGGLLNIGQDMTGSFGSTALTPYDELTTPVDDTLDIDFSSQLARSSFLGDGSDDDEGSTTFLY